MEEFTVVVFELKSNQPLLEITKNCSNKTHHLVPQLDESRLPFLWSFPLLGSRPVTDSPSLWLNCAKWFLGGGSPRFECASGHVGSPSPLARPRSTGRGNLPQTLPRPPSSTMVHQAPPSRLLSLSQALSLSPRDSGGGSRLNKNTSTVGDVPQNNYFHHKKINEGSKLGSFSSFGTSPASTLLGFELEHVQGLPPW